MPLYADRRKLQTALLFARAMNEKVPLRKDGEVPSEVRRWSDFVVLGSLK